MPLSPTQRFSLAPDVLLQRFEDKALLLDLSGEKVYQLNKTGARVAELASQGHTLEDLLAQLDREFAASQEEMARDVREILADLQEHRLLVPA